MKVKTNVYLTSGGFSAYGLTVEDLYSTDPKTQEKVLNHVALSPLDMTSVGWTLLGEAEVEIALRPKEELLAYRQSTQKKIIEDRIADRQKELGQLNQELAMITGDTVTPYESCK